MPIRCRECEATGLPHDEHCTPEEVRALQTYAKLELARRAQVNAMWQTALTAEETPTEEP